MKKEVVSYVTQNGKIPIEDYLDEIENQNRKLYSKVIVKLEQLESGNGMCHGDVEHFEGKIFELRVKQSTNISRVFFCYYCEDKIIVLMGYTKKTNKTPGKIKRLLDSYYQDFLENSTYI